MKKQDIATIIDLHFEELTELEQEIARYFLQVDTIVDDLSSQQVTQKLHVSQAALTRFAKNSERFLARARLILQNGDRLWLRYLACS